MYWLMHAHYEGKLLMAARAIKWFAIGGAVALMLVLTSAVVI